MKCKAWSMWGNGKPSSSITSLDCGQKDIQEYWTPEREEGRSINRERQENVNWHVQLFTYKLNAKLKVSSYQ